jgi:hypothetical protein
LDIRDTPEFLEIAHRVRDGLRAGHCMAFTAVYFFENIHIQSYTRYTACTICTYILYNIIVQSDVHLVKTVVEA